VQAIRHIRCHRRRARNNYISYVLHTAWLDLGQKSAELSFTADPPGRELEGYSLQCFSHSESGGVSPFRGRLLATFFGRGVYDCDHDLPQRYPVYALYKSCLGDPV